jgi:hypothetical protein
MIQRKRDTPTDPVTAKMPDGVEKTVLGVSGYQEPVKRIRTSSSNHFVQNNKHSRRITKLLVVLVDVGLIILYACTIIDGRYR